MSPLQGLFAAVAAVVLFLYGLQGFSHELQVIGGPHSSRGSGA
jgi:hypothetical protein